MANRIVQTDYAPAAIGPYSQGAFTQIALYCSGQLGIDPATGKLADGIEEQATQAFKNLRAVITEAGLTMADIVKVTIFLTDMANFDAVNKAMKTFVPAPFPAPLKLRQSSIASVSPSEREGPRTHAAASLCPACRRILFSRL